MKTRKPITAASLMREVDLENAIVQCMELDGWRSLKQEQNFSEKKLKLTGEAGMPDRLFIRYDFDFARSMARVLWWEFKIRKGKASEVQKWWIAAEKARGALVWLAGVDHEATIEGAARHYLDSGLCRRPELFENLIPLLRVELGSKQA